ncbi:hypothetical protein GETHLI_26770 [Geothrix limicola]|uniref:Peptidase C1A papain C-terminal domain-containing protein n=1 Tax=Geothrix limicola TaxID=2927978 RepID=A0ABQ5QIH0_9BACT|nr:hypothetical protein [Geothrix limicola]GLH74175.1 hypothetical protein GETHLI_26770 [Geothrix limicola]
MANAPHPHRIALIPEHASKRGGRLGRHIHFDDRSWDYRVPLRTGATIQTRIWTRTLKAFNQGELGSCTGNGAVGVVCTQPYRKPGARYSEALARKVYSQASHDDTIVGAWPPKDTGSTVLGAMKALKDLGFTKGYHWCFGLEDVLKTLSTLGPVEVGLNWYEGFDKPDAKGLVKLGGAVRGGHAFELLGVDAERKLVWAINSWGSDWGLDGRFAFSWKDLDRLLHEDGEASTVQL